MVFDIVFLVVCGIGFIAGYKRGIIYMAFFLAALFFGTFATLKFNTVTYNFLESQFNLSGPFMPLLSLVITFVVVFALVLWISDVLTKALKLILLNSINKLIGGALGALSAASIFSIGVWYINGLQVFPEDFANQSNIYDYCISFAPYAIEQISNIIPYTSNLYEQLEIMFEESIKNK